MSSSRTRGNKHKLKHRKLHFFFFLNTVKVVITGFRDIQNTSGHSLDQPALADPALTKELDQIICRGAFLPLPACASKLIGTKHTGPFKTQYWKLLCAKEKEKNNGRERTANWRTQVGCQNRREYRHFPQGREDSLIGPVSLHNYLICDLDSSLGFYFSKFTKMEGGGGGN